LRLTFADARQSPAAQKGTEAEIVLEGARLSDAKEILFYDSAITVHETDAGG